MWFLIVTLFPSATPLGVLTGHVVAIGLYSLLFIKGKLKLPANLRYLSLSTIIFLIAIFFSLLVNINRGTIGIGIIKYAFIPLYWLFALYTGITDFRLFKGKRPMFLFYMAVIFIVIQLPVVFLQLIGAKGLTSTLWISNKASGFTHLLRVVGTVQNPNSLGILCVLAIIIFVQYFNKKRLWSTVLILISIIIIITTGSRTSLILLFLLPFFHIRKKQFFSKKSLYILLSGVSFLVLVYYLLLNYQNAFPYMSQILNLISAGKVHTLQTRFFHWNQSFEIYKASSVMQHIFGLGAGYFTVMDNSYFYILFNYGIVGLLTFIGLLGSIFIMIHSQDNKIALRYLFVMLVAGTVTDLMINFMLMTITFYLIGFKAEFQHSRLPRFDKGLAYVK